MANALETITVDGTVFTVLFPNLVRRLTDREWKDLKSSIVKDRVQIPIIVDENNGIIDGGNRARIVAEQSWPLYRLPTQRCRLGMSEEDKRQLALSLNIDRRHLTPKERAKLVEARRKRVRQARAEGKSLRTIAEEEGVSRELIRKDLASDAGVNGLTPDGVQQSPSADGPAPSAVDTSPADSSPQPTAETSAPLPARIKGRDGKRHPSKKNKKSQEDKSKKKRATCHSLTDQQQAQVDKLNAAWDAADPAVRDKFLEQHQLSYA